jgi:DNA excision repair protein ERCC-4
VVVDMREFRSSLPAILYSRGLTVKPCTLEVGDYVLSPNMVVERKSIPDLVGSFKSGRLYTQAEAMTIHYKVAILLIEFEENKAFSFQVNVFLYYLTRILALLTFNDNSMHTQSMSADISFQDVQSKLVLLTKAFPALRIIWSSSPLATGEIFEELKQTQEEPDADRAMAIGVDNRDEINTMYSITPSDVLRALPGITAHNARMVMHRVENIKALSEMSRNALEQLIGKERGELLHQFLRKTRGRRR